MNAGQEITISHLMEALGDAGSDAGIRTTARLDPIGGDAATVKPAVYSGGRYQYDKRWASPDHTEPTDVIVIDNSPSQANRIEAALVEHRQQLGIPELILDLTDGAFDHLPAHLPRQISSWKWPHRHADAYFIDSLIGDQPSHKHPLGDALFSATASEASALVSWFPQSLLFGFWQSHLGKKRAQTKHARAWVSEIVGWNPAASQDIESGEPSTRTLSTKGDPMNIGSDVKVSHDDRDRFAGYKVVSGRPKEKERPSSLGHGQVPSSDGRPSGVSFQRITQTSLVSFPLLRRVKLGPGYSPQADTAARALLVALGLHGHDLAFGSAFHLRSGADLRPSSVTTVWLGGDGDTQSTLSGTSQLLADAKQQARLAGVPLEGWDAEATRVIPSQSLRELILNTWPDLDAASVS